MILYISKYYYFCKTATPDRRGLSSQNSLSELFGELFGFWFEPLFVNCSLKYVHKCSLNFWRAYSRTVSKLSEQFAQASQSVSHPKNLKIHLESLKALQEACKKPYKYLENP